MLGGRRILLLSGIFAAASCTASHQVQVRAIPYKGTTSKTGDLLAQAYGQLALGNVGLALESLRELQLQQPENPDVLEGIAQCYAAMSRYDLARTNLEFALAYAPNDPKLLNELASSLDQLGERDQAIQVRTEAARLISPPTAHLATEQADITPIGVPRTGSVTVKLPAPALSTRTAAAAPVSTFAGGNTPVDHVAAPSSLPRRQPLPDMRLPTVEMATEPSPAPARLSKPAIDPAPSPREAVPSDRTNTAQATSLLADHSVLGQTNYHAVGGTSDAPLPSTSATAIPVPKASQTPIIDDRLVVSRRPIETANENTRLQGGPRLERTSRSEVALITTVPHIQVPHLQRALARPPTIASAPPEPRPAPLPQKKPQQLAVAATHVQWVPLKSSSLPQNVELLNAARLDGLAARTRMALRDSGWRKIRIGNARNVRQHSLVLYGMERTQIAHRLSAQFRCAAVKVKGLKQVVVLLGRDAALRRGLSASI